MPDFVIIGSDGREHQFPDGMDPKFAIQVVKNTELKEANAKPLHEPADYWGGVRKGANDFATEVGNNLFSSMAHPGIETETGYAKPKLDTAAELLGLTLPSTMGAGGTTIRGMKTVASLGEVEPIGNRVIRGGAKLAADGLELTPKIITSKAETKVIKGLRAFGDRTPRITETPQERLARVKPSRSPAAQTTDRVPYSPSTEYTPVENLQDSLVRPRETTFPDRGVESGELPESTGAMVDRYKPNVGGEPDLGVSHDEMLQSTSAMVDRYHPNTSGTIDAGVPQGEMPTGTPPPEVESALESLMRRRQGGESAPVQTDRVPYATPTESLGEPTGKVAGKAPTLEEVLIQTLEEARSGETPTFTTAAPDVETAGGGSFKQSWPKSKRQNLGGYSSGRPAVTDTRMEELLNKFGGTEGAAEGVTVTPGAAEVAAPVAETVESAAPVADAVTAKPKLSAADLAQSLRRHYGSRDGGAFMNPSDPKAGAEMLKRLAPGPSRTPIVAEQRIAAARGNVPESGGESLQSLLAKIIEDRAVKPE